MNEIPTGIRKRGLIAFAASVLGLVLTNTVMIFVMPEPEPNSAARLVQSRWAQAAATGERGSAGSTEDSSIPPAKVDLLVVGDSSCTLGIDPLRLGQRMQKRSANAGLIGSFGVWGDVWMLEHYSRVGGLGESPTVIVVHAADVWMADTFPGFHQYLAAIPESNFDVVKKMIRARPRANDWGTLTFHRGGLPLLEVKDRLRSRIDGDLPAPKTSSDAWPWHGRWLLDDSRANPPTMHVAIRDYPRRLRDSATLSPQTELALNELAKWAAQHDAKVVLTTGPIVEDIARQAVFQQRWAKTRRALEMWADSSPEIETMLERWQTFPASVMENPNHLVRSSAQIYTDELARELKVAKTAGGF